MSKETVVKIAGENAVWPESEESRRLVIDQFVVKIKAGSTGRPDKRLETENWFGNLESLMGLIAQVENKRMLGVADGDNPYYRIIEKTLKVLDQAEDVTTLMPKQKETLIDKVLNELASVMEQRGIDPAILQQIPSIQEYIQRKQESVNPQQ